MDQIKSGHFIAQRRKELGLTQRELAEALSISDKTVSKWETGKGFPEVSLMLPLCDRLGITVNELLSGQRLTEEEYREKAEENMKNLVKEAQESRKKIILSGVVIGIALLAFMALVMVAGYLQMETWTRVVLIVLGVVILVAGCAAGTVLDLEAGAFQCPQCGARFVPTAREYLMGPHTITKRRLKCHQCGKTSYCKRVLTK